MDAIAEVVLGQQATRQKQQESMKDTLLPQQQMASQQQFEMQRQQYSEAQANARQQALLAHEDKTAQERADEAILKENFDVYWGLVPGGLGPEGRHEVGRAGIRWNSPTFMGDLGDYERKIGVAVRTPKYREQAAVPGQDAIPASGGIQPGAPGLDPTQPMGGIVPTQPMGPEIPGKPAVAAQPAQQVPDGFTETPGRHLETHEEYENAEKEKIAGVAQAEKKKTDNRMLYQSDITRLTPMVKESVERGEADTLAGTQLRHQLYHATKMLEMLGNPASGPGGPTESDVDMSQMPKGWPYTSSETTKQKDMEADTQRRLKQADSRIAQANTREKRIAAKNPAMKPNAFMTSFGTSLPSLDEDVKLARTEVNTAAKNFGAGLPQAKQHLESAVSRKEQGLDEYAKAAGGGKQGGGKRSIAGLTTELKAAGKSQAYIKAAVKNARAAGLQ
jgi:hypothetical protein